MNILPKINDQPNFEIEEDLFSNNTLTNSISNLAKCVFLKKKNPQIIANPTVTIK